MNRPSAKRQGPFSSSSLDPNRQIGRNVPGSADIKLVRYERACKIAEEITVRFERVF